MSYNSVILKRYNNIQNSYVAASVIAPGDLVELTSAGTVRKHSGAGKTASFMFALEDALQGKGLGSNYAAGDVVRCWVATPGEEVYASFADEDSVAIGDFVESNGAGQLRKAVRSQESWESADAQAAHSGYDRHIVGQVLVALDTTSLSTVDSSEAGRTGEHHVVIRIV